MRTLFSFIVGLGIGATLGMLVIAIFSPVSGEAFKANLREHYQNALQSARDASAQRRAELEEELTALKSD
jgi:gas vesicle protein